MEMRVSPSFGKCFSVNIGEVKSTGIEVLGRVANLSRNGEAISTYIGRGGKKAVLFDVLEGKNEVVIKQLKEAGIPYKEFGKFDVVI